jgi:predicted phage terminase large subunit-like protein
MGSALLRSDVDEARQWAQQRLAERTPLREVPEAAHPGRESLAAYHRELHPNWTTPEHHLRIFEHIEAIAAQPGRFGMINMPPRHGKSTTATGTAASWLIGHDQRVAVVSYGANLAGKFTRSLRNDYATGGRAQAVFPEKKLASEAGECWHFEGVDPLRPNCVAAGVGGPLTGMGFDWIIIDDPVKNDEEARSETVRAHIKEWFEGTCLTRLEPGGHILNIMTRWHEDDLAGWQLAEHADDWSLLHMPAINEAGEALWPERYPIDALEKIREKVGPRTWQALYQGDPTPSDGVIWKRNWFDDASYTGAPPDLVSVITAWDTAVEEGQANDYTAWCRIGTDAFGRYWVLDVGRRRVDFPDLIRLVERGAGGGEDEVAVVEDASSGKSAIQTLRKQSRRSVVKIAAVKSKVIRAQAVAPFVEAGSVHLPRGHELYETLVGECTKLPHGRHDDLHDAFVHGLRYLTKGLGADDDLWEAVRA